MRHALPDLISSCPNSIDASQSVFSITLDRLPLPQNNCLRMEGPAIRVLDNRTHICMSTSEMVLHNDIIQCMSILIQR
jgi:hypothetical protein